MFIQSFQNSNNVILLFLCLHGINGSTKKKRQAQNLSSSSEALSAEWSKLTHQDSLARTCRYLLEYQRFKKCSCKRSDLSKHLQRFWSKEWIWQLALMWISQFKKAPLCCRESRQGAIDLKSMVLEDYKSINFLLRVPHWIWYDLKSVCKWETSLALLADFVWLCLAQPRFKMVSETIQNSLRYPLSGHSNHAPVV